MAILTNKEVNMITICFIDEYNRAVVRVLPAVPSVGDTMPLWEGKPPTVQRVIWFPLEIMTTLKDRLDGIAPDVVVMCE
jgi:hypothetical protein